MSLTLNFRVAKICKLCGRLDLTMLADGLVKRGPSLRVVRASGRPDFRGSIAAGVCVVEKRDAQSPMSGKKFTPYRAWIAAPDDSGGVLDEGRMPDSRKSAASPNPHLFSSATSA